MNEYTRLFKGRMEIAPMHFPYRKKVGLAIYDPHSNCYIKVATFNNEDSADYFMEYLAKFCGVDTGEETRHK